MSGSRSELWREGRDSPYYDQWNKGSGRGANVSEFKIKFTTENAAFEDLDNAEQEIARILLNVAQRVQFGGRGGTVLDINGNVIGVWSWGR